MEQEHNPHEIIGTLYCEDATKYDIKLGKTIVHLFKNGSFPCIEIRDDEIQSDRYIRIPNYAVPEAMAQYGVRSIEHASDEDYRSDADTFTDKEGNAYQWDFQFNDSEQSVGTELLEHMRPSEETGYAYEYYEALDEETLQPQEEPEIELDHENTLLIEIDDEQNLNLSFLVITTGEGLEYLPASPQVVDLIKQNGWEHQRWDLDNINETMWNVIEKVHGNWLRDELTADASKLL